MEREAKQRKREAFERKRAGVLALKSSLKLLLEEFSRKKEELSSLFTLLREKERELLLYALNTVAERVKLEVESGEREEVPLSITDTVVGLSDLLYSTNASERWEQGRRSSVSYTEFSRLREASLKVGKGTLEEKISFLRALLERGRASLTNPSRVSREKRWRTSIFRSCLALWQEEYLFLSP
jgi:hypothetical protein